VTRTPAQAGVLFVASAALCDFDHAMKPAGAIRLLREQCSGMALAMKPEHFPRTDDAYI
jgi:hypothetical protein